MAYIYIVRMCIRSISFVASPDRWFEVEKKIGHGQFSVVYRAKNTVDGETVALKKIQV